jgi:maltooligosyltrehalose trehalohydrolase
MTTTAATRRRRLSAGIELMGDGTAHARVWAPACRSVDLVSIDGSSGTLGVAQPLVRTADGFFEALVEGLPAGTRYWFRLDGERLRPDPVSRFQPEGPHGPSQVVDPGAFRWTDQRWGGLSPAGQVLYEMHVGTFTPEGTWRAAAEQLEELASLGVTTIEMMPVAEFCGRWGWGYDGVNLYAPTRVYGSPDDLRAFIDVAHRVGLAVILDVVYNHFGPDGNYIAEFSPDYFTTRYRNDWGQPINFEGPAAARDFFIENGAYWIDEFHVDGLRLDATQDIHDASVEHVIASIARRAREAAGARRIYLVAENEPQLSHLVREPASGGFGLDAIWNDDYHHSAVVALTGRRDAYFTDYRGTGQELISCAKHGFLFQGQWYVWQKKRRGTPSRDLPHRAFVHYLENHDQVANTGFGRRLHQVTAPGVFRAMTALTLLGPATPLLFQGQEFNSSSPFVYFVDHKPELQEAIRTGRLEFLSQFATLNDREASERLPLPASEEAFSACKLDFSERQRNSDAYALHRDLLALRREDPVLAASGDRPVDGAVLGPGAFVLRYFGEGGDRLLVVNLDRDLQLAPAPEPLLAPPLGRHWVMTWHSESPRYGGGGLPEIAPEAEWRMPGQCAVFFVDERSPEDGRSATP